MTCVRAGVGAQGCDPITNAQRIVAWERRMTAWVAAQREPDAEDLARGRRAAAGQKFQKALKQRPRVRLRPKRAKKSNVVQLPVQRRTQKYTKGHRAKA